MIPRFFLLLLLFALISTSLSHNNIDQNSNDNPLLERRQLVAVEDTTLPHPVDRNYASLGYVSDHNATCTLRFYNTSEGHAAGDRDLEKMSNKFKSHLNEVFARQVSNVASEPPVLITMTEIMQQLIGSATVESRRLQRRVLLTNQKWTYNYAQVKLNYVCPPSTCWSDNSAQRRRRRQLNDQRVLQSLPDKYLMSLKNSGKEYFQSISCLMVSCDGDVTWEESGGCVDVPDLPNP